MNTITVGGIFAKPPSNPASDWRPCIVSYRAVAAGYHEGDRADTGHYWALVRGTEPARAAVQARLGYRRCNDAECTSDTRLTRDLRWDDASVVREAASRRVMIVALERVDTARARKSLSERENELGRPTR